jgi:hypothetical protein
MAPALVRITPNGPHANTLGFAGLGTFKAAVLKTRRPFFVDSL